MVEGIGAVGDEQSQAGEKERNIMRTRRRHRADAASLRSTNPLESAPRLGGYEPERLHDAPLLVPIELGRVGRIGGIDDQPLPLEV